MDIAIDKFVLLLLSMLSLLFVPFNPAFVIAFFTAVTCTTLLYAFPDGRFQAAAVTCVSALLYFVSDFIFFLPLLIYDYIPAPQNEKSPRQSLLFRVPALLLLLGAFFRQRRAFADFSRLLLLASGCLVSLLLRMKTNSYAALSRQFRQARDTDTEIKLLLEEKNQTLAEKQNSEIYAATLRERNRIAREIHDNVGHMLTRSILMVGALKTVSKDASLAKPLDQLETTLTQSMDSIRTSVHDLHDNSVNLKEALQTMLREFSYCPVRLDYSVSPEIPKDVKYCFISIAREALVNIARHSNATSAAVTAVEHPGFYQLIIQDNGNTSGYDLTAEDRFARKEASASGIGLDNIRSRVKALNGNLQFRTSPGFRIYITIPKRDNPALENTAGKKVELN